MRTQLESGTFDTDDHYSGRNNNLSNFEHGT